MRGAEFSSRPIGCTCESSSPEVVPYEETMASAGTPQCGCPGFRVVPTAFRCAGSPASLFLMDKDSRELVTPYGDACGSRYPN